MGVQLELPTAVVAYIPTGIKGWACIVSTYTQIYGIICDSFLLLPKTPLRKIKAIYYAIKKHPQRDLSKDM